MTINFQKKPHQDVEQGSLYQSLSEDQLSQVLSAILDGKYSWACALFLRFTGHDPRNYLPYRTYIRLVKECCQRNDKTGSLKKNGSDNSVSSSEAKRRRRKIADLNHLEPLDEVSSGILGGSRSFQQWEIDSTFDTAELDSVMEIPIFS